MNSKQGSSSNRWDSGEGGQKRRPEDHQPQEENEIELTELLPARRKLIGAQLKLTNECCKAIRDAKRARLPVVFEHTEEGTFIDVHLDVHEAKGGEKKRFDCSVQKLDDKSLVDVIAVNRRSGDYRKFVTLESKFQVKATDVTFSNMAQNAKNIADSQRKAQTIQGVHTKGQKRSALIQPATSSKVQKLLSATSASSTPTYPSSSANEKPTSSSLHGSRGKPKPKWTEPPAKASTQAKVARTSNDSKPESASGMGKPSTAASHTHPTHSSASSSLRNSSPSEPKIDSSNKKLKPRPESPFGGRNEFGGKRVVADREPTKSTTTAHSQIAPSNTSSASSQLFSSHSNESSKVVRPHTPSSYPTKLNPGNNPATLDTRSSGGIAGGSTRSNDEQRIHPAPSVAKDKPDTNAPSKATPTAKPSQLKQSGTSSSPEFAAIERNGRSAELSPKKSPKPGQGRRTPQPPAVPTSLSSSGSTRLAHNRGNNNPVETSSSPITEASPQHPPITQQQPATIRPDTNPNNTSCATNGTLPSMVNGHSSGLNGTTASTIDWWSRLPAPKERGNADEYRAMYKTDYEEYLKLYKQLDKVAGQFKKLKVEFDRGHNENEAVRKIRSLYEKYQDDGDFFVARQRHTELRAKLVVLKQRLADWETALRIPDSDHRREIC